METSSAGITFAVPAITPAAPSESVAGRFDRFPGAERTGLCDDRDSFGRLVDDGLDRMAPFGSAHRGELTGGSTGDDAVHTAVDNEAARLRRVKIERCVRYMIAQLPEDDVAPHLWTSLAGRPRLRPEERRGVVH